MIVKIGVFKEQINIDLRNELFLFRVSSIILMHFSVAFVWG